MRHPGELTAVLDRRQETAQPSAVDVDAQVRHRPDRLVATAAGTPTSISLSKKRKKPGLEAGQSAEDPVTAGDSLAASPVLPGAQCRFPLARLPFADQESDRQTERCSVAGRRRLHGSPEPFAVTSGRRSLENRGKAPQEGVTAFLRPAARALEHRGTFQRRAKPVDRDDGVTDAARRLPAA